MKGLPLLSRVPNHVVTDITFDGATTGGIGEINNQDIVFTVTGQILLLQLSAYCTTVMAGASATISLGTANNVAELIAVTTATELDANEVWRSATPDVEAGPAAVTDYVVGSNIILETLVADADTGVIRFSAFWLPLSLDGKLD